MQPVITCKLDIKGEVSSLSLGTIVSAVINFVSSLLLTAVKFEDTFQVTYLNAYAKFVDSHTIEAKNKKGKIEALTADRFLIATGLRPRFPDVPGALECCISRYFGFLGAINYEIGINTAYKIRQLILRSFFYMLCEVNSYKFSLRKSRNGV